MNNTNSSKKAIVWSVIAVIVLIAIVIVFLRTNRVQQGDMVQTKTDATTTASTVPAGWQRYSYSNLGLAFNYYKGAIVSSGKTGVALSATSSEQYHLVASSEPIYTLDIEKSTSCESGDSAPTPVVINGMQFQKSDVSAGYSGKNSLQYVNSYCADISGSKWVIDVRVQPRDNSQAEKQKAFAEIDSFMNQLDPVFTN